MTMDSESMTRRLAILKRRPAYRDYDEEYLKAMLDNAYSFFLEYTFRAKDLGERIDSLIVEIAVYYLDSEGAQNTKHAKDGELEREYFEGLPPMVLNRLAGYRTVIGVNAEFGI